MSVYFNPEDGSQIICDDRPEGWLTAEEYHEAKWGKASEHKDKLTPYPSVEYDWEN